MLPAVRLSALAFALAVLALVSGFAGAARADSLDDTLALFLTDKFPDTQKAIGQLAEQAPPRAAAILEALGDNRLMADPASHVVAIRATDGGLVDARTGEPLASPDGFRKVRVSNALRVAIDSALGTLTLASPDPDKRLAAAAAAFKSRDAKALPALKSQLARESDRRVADAINLAVAAILAESESATSADRLSAIEALKARGDRDAESLIAAIGEKAADPDVKAAAQSALTNVRTRLMLWGAAQDLWYGLSASSVLLLAAIGLAITFGVMGVINMAHGEMVMLGAYATYVVQLLLPPSLQSWSLAFAIPLAFVVAAAVGVLIERLIIRYLYTRPLETLLATWGVSLILQQTVRSTFGAANRQVSNPPFMSGAFHVGGLEITLNRMWIIALAIVVFVGLQFVLRATRFGLQMRAVTQNRRMAAAMGVSTARVDMLAFALGSGVAGIAGVALSQIDNVSPNLGQGYIIDSFMVVVFGGVGNLWGTALGALMIGVAGKILEPLIGAVQGQIVLLVVIILFIQKRPRGMFALKGRAVEA
ncbi:amino acid/amide ABC transporter membrane protein 1 (HAAT family) [Roseiarcus fermentans]|uniref:Amino acid/amide ABC transporter membrane protein 1 (HAAT family) n=1 Tax=Roseiarcus fermentans TaxID=1473586 RepID=A0A366F7I9_9HYPH|nr:urea ABC transporter permease subunit UrtB [Roseiarcus fermentans]RBP10631.1 amino acid/amide ABC transporter membrane protein 1 (HAAT family) [Roseiarcus fermentans]